MSVATQDQIEETCRKAWPALEEHIYDGWLIRLGGAVTRRTNSATVNGHGFLPLATKVRHCEEFFRSHGQRPVFRLLSTAPADIDAYLAQSGYRKEDETITLLMSLDGVVTDAASGVVIAAGRPSEEWLAAHRRISGGSEAETDARHTRLTLINVPVFYAAARDGEGRIVSLAYGAIFNRRICLEWVMTDPECRRQGHSRAAVLALLGRARSEGAAGACLQVVAANLPAVRMYEMIGFDEEAYRYHYRVAADGQP